MFSAAPMMTVIMLKVCSPWVVMNRYHAQRYHHKEGTGGIDAHIVKGVADGILAGAEEPEEFSPQELEGGGQQQRGDDHAGEAGAEDALGLVVVTAAHGDGGPGRAALADQGRKADSKYTTGKQSPTPVRAMSPTTGI